MPGQLLGSRTDEHPVACTVRQSTGLGLQGRMLIRYAHMLLPAAASPLEKEYAHQQAAVVNAAYDVLKKPLRRAHYIVSGHFSPWWR